VFTNFSDQPITYDNWYPNEPNGDVGTAVNCVKMKVGPQWKDHICTNETPRVCQQEIEPGTE